MTTAWERTGRPKPQRITWPGYAAYMYAHDVYCVWYSRVINAWWVEGRNFCEHFPTFAEAIAYAQQQARKDTQ